MKKSHYLSLLFAITLVVGGFNASAQEDPSVIPGETWRVITEADNGKTIIIHLNEKLTVMLTNKRASNWDLSNNTFFLKVASPNLLKESLDGPLYRSLDGYRYGAMWMLQPLAVGTTQVTIRDGGLWPKNYASFTINVVE